MRSDEYDAFNNDPSDYMFRIHLSRVSEELAGLAELPKLSYLHEWMGAETLALAFASPNSARAIRTLQKTGRELQRVQARLRKFDRMLLNLGFPACVQGDAMPPYDLISIQYAA